MNSAWAMLVLADGGEEQRDVEPEREAGRQHAPPRRRGSAPAGRCGPGARRRRPTTATTAMIIRQNARTEPGTSAHLMIVELLGERQHGGDHREHADRRDGVAGGRGDDGGARSRSRRRRCPVDVGLDEHEVGGRHDGAQVAARRRRWRPASSSTVSVGSNSSFAATSSSSGPRCSVRRWMMRRTDGAPLERSGRSSRCPPASPTRRSAGPSSRPPARWR